MNIHEFKKKFDEEYDFLYSAHDRVGGFTEAVNYFDMNILQIHPEFVQEFNSYRGDVISSDREAAAFTFAFFDLLDE